MKYKVAKWHLTSSPSSFIVILFPLSHAGSHKAHVSQFEKNKTGQTEAIQMTQKQLDKVTFLGITKTV